MCSDWVFKRTWFGLHIVLILWLDAVIIHWLRNTVFFCALFAVSLVFIYFWPPAAHAYSSHAQNYKKFCVIYLFFPKLMAQ